MTRRHTPPDFRHDAPARTGVLLINLGTPDAPTPRALRRYLAEFLWDPRVVEIPRPLWWLILHGVVLRTRPRRSAALYRKIWMPEGSPLLVLSQRLRRAMASALEATTPSTPVVVVLGMRYGNPSIASALQNLRAANAQKLLVLPLYPQYAAATTGSAFDAVTRILRSCRWLPELQFIGAYHDHAPYIAAMAARIRAHWEAQGRSPHLLLSFHGLPERSLRLGDPYFYHCQKTARLLMEALDLEPGQATVSFQSRFGRAEWLKPYTWETLKQLAAGGAKTVDVFCPGFATDCLETLEEIAMQNSEIFKAAGGQALHYIPALNDSEEHVQVLIDLVRQRLQAWDVRPGKPEMNTERQARAGTPGATA